MLRTKGGTQKGGEYMKERILVRKAVLAGPYGGSTPADPEPYNPYEGHDRPEYTVATRRPRLRLVDDPHESKDYDKEGDKGNWDTEDMLRKEVERRGLQ